MKKVLVVDAGGRGNATAHSFARSPKVSNVYVAPGNAGSSLLEKCRQLPIKSIGDLANYVSENRIDLTFIGPEGYLSDGIVNEFYARGIDRVVGPSKEASILETSKCWTKDFLKIINVPIPVHKNFYDVKDAFDYVKHFYENNSGKNLVVKADGIAAGKGSFVCNSLEDALYAIDQTMVKKVFGKAGDNVEIEEKLSGEELMFFVITDGKTILPLETAMDYKRAFDDDDEIHPKYFGGRNPNTGGMGGYSPHPWLDEELKEKIMKKIAVPTITKLREIKNIEYKGICYFGLMISEDNNEKNPYVLEINVRMGDPEAQVILPRLKTDFYDLSEAVIENRLHKINLEWDPTYRFGLCAVSGQYSGLTGFDDSVDIHGNLVEEWKYPGYPGPHRTGFPIWGLKDVESETLVFHNGTVFQNSDKKSNSGSNIVSSGGRVLTLVTKGKTLEESRNKAYSEIQKITFSNIRYRRGIGS